MQKQFMIEPQSFKISSSFGPQIAEIKLPDEILLALSSLSDKVLSSKDNESHGEALAGVIRLEKKIYKSDFINFGVDRFLDTCVKSYIIHCANVKGIETNSCTVNSFINDAWVVSQFENEYNPLHNHRTCEVSAVIYIKTPLVKGRRGIESKKHSYDNDGDINFVYSSSSQRDGDIFETGMRSLEPKKGMMLLFPSYLMHCVYPFVGPEERRSIAFNATFQILKDSGNNQKQYIAGSKLGLNANHEFIDT